MAAAYALLSLVLGALAVALLWSWSPLAALLGAPVAASAGVLIAAALRALLPSRSQRPGQGRMLPAE